MMLIDGPAEQQYLGWPATWGCSAEATGVRQLFSHVCEGEQLSQSITLHIPPML